MKGLEEWRARNAGNVLARAERRMETANKPVELLNRTHPRLLYIIFDHSSWHDAEDMQEMWAGLLVSSALGDTYDESNLVFVGILSQMTANEVRILNHACYNATKVVSDDGVIAAEQYECSVSELMRVAQITELFRLDFQVDHLRALGLFPFGIEMAAATRQFVADITPSSLALYMYVRCRGFAGPPSNFFTVA